MGKQNDTTLLAERQVRPNPLFDPKALKGFVAERSDLVFAKTGCQALWLFPNGQLVQPNEKGDQERIVYHYVIKDYFKHVGIENGPEIERKDKHVFNNLVTKGVGVVNLVPETGAALKGDAQDLTEQQRDFLQANDYRLYSYIKNQPVTVRYLTKIDKI